MNSRLIRFVTTAVTAAVVSVMGAGVANAAVADRATAQFAAATGQDTHTAAQYLRQLHDYVAVAVELDDVAAVDAALRDLRPMLGAVTGGPVERAAAVAGVQADAQAARIQRDLPGLTVLAPLGGLVASLLAAVIDLVTSLLGGPPVPLPTPDLPAPELPDVPGVPTPELPDAPLPDAPLP